MPRPYGNFPVHFARLVIDLPDFRAHSNCGFTDAEQSIVNAAIEGSESRLQIFFRLLEHAKLNAKGGKRVRKILLGLKQKLGFRGTLAINVRDPVYNMSVPLQFTLPRELFEKLLDMPLTDLFREVAPELVSGNESQSDLLVLLQADLLVLKLVFAYGLPADSGRGTLRSLCFSQ